MLAGAISALAALVAARDALADGDEFGVTRILTGYGPIALRLNGQEGSSAHV